MSLELKKRLFTSITLLLSTIIMFFSNLFFVFFLIIFLTVGIVEFLNIINRIHKNIFKKMISNALFISYIFVLFSILLQFSVFYNLKIIIFTIILICISSDIGGYIFGKIFMGPKLSRISPNKTYAGMAGSFLLSIIAASIYSEFFIEKISNITIQEFIFVLIISLISQIGDLIISFFKRKAKLKDTGHILPGHGGLLDRLDGIVFVFLFLFFAKFII